VARAVGPRRLQRHAHVAVLEQLEALLRDRGAAEVAAQALEADAVGRSDGDAGVEIETGEMGVKGASRVNPGRARITPPGIGAASNRVQLDNVALSAVADERGVCCDR
jgi:hypothetical protein